MNMQVQQTESFRLSVNALHLSVACHITWYIMMIVCMYLIIQRSVIYIETKKLNEMTPLAFNVFITAS